MGKLFWKFFIFIWLGQMAAVFGTGALFWYERQSAEAAGLAAGQPQRTPPDFPGRRPPPELHGADGGPRLPPPEAHGPEGAHRPPSLAVRGAGDDRPPPPHRGGRRPGGGLPVLPLLAGFLASLLCAAGMAWYFARPIRHLRDALIAKCREGVPVWFLYDEIGSKDLPAAYARSLREAGVSVRPFHSTRGSGNRFQLNFRNHRKIVVVDGRVGWVGGHNVGDEYLGRDPGFTTWRDTHVRIEGPAALELQLSFLEDWRWATDETLQLDWEPHAAEGSDAVVLVLPSGPADRLETASLMYQQAIHSARERLWIASPYFVPDEGVLAALHLAALRGVDVRLIVPDEPDSRLVYYSAWAFAEPLLESGIRILRYEQGFLHQKVFLVDDRLAGVGTANLDNRSFRLNFEVTALIADAGVVAAVEAMLVADQAHARPMTADEVRGKPWWFRALARASFLTAPIQ